MKNTRSLRVKLLCLFSFALAAVLPARAQDQALSPIPGVGHDYIHLLDETVEPEAGSANVQIKLTVPKSRGETAFPFSISYNSAVVVPGGISLENQPVHWMPLYPSPALLYAGGWSYAVPLLTYRYGEQAALPPQHGSCNYTTKYAFHDPSGGSHWVFPNAKLASPLNDPCNGISYSQDSAGDNEYRASISSAGTYVADASGTVYNFSNQLGIVSDSSGSSSAALPLWVEDRNGNRLNVTATPLNSSTQPPSLTVTDALGRTALATSGFGATGNTITVSGLSGDYSVTWGTATSNYTPTANIILGSGYCFWGGVNLTQAVITAITLPNGKQYQFSYDPTYGTLSKIVYPTGAYVSYVWGYDPQSELATWTGTDSVTCLAIYDAPAVVSRIVSFDGQTAALEQDFSYSTTWISGSSNWSSKTTTVTTKDDVRNTSFQTVYVYSSTFDVNGSEAPVEQTITYKSPSGAVLRTVTKGWNDQFQLTCELEKIDNGLISGTFYSYGFGSQITDKKEYDFGQITSTSACQNGSVAPSSPLPVRETATTYQVFGNTPIYNPAPSTPSIFDRPCRIVVTDGSGSRVAETDYTYDGGTSVCGTAGTPSVAAVSGLPTGTHDESDYSQTSSAPRANVTSVTRLCLQSAPACTNGNPTTTYTYDETGQVLSMTDPCGHTTCDGSGMIGSHTTSYAYADSYTPCSGAAPPAGNTNAYLTEVTDPLGHTNNFCYGYTDGQLRSTTDPNSQTTSYTYNDPLDRLTQTTYPTGGGETIYTYNDTPPTPSVTIQQELSAGTFLTTVHVMDGVGHPIQTQLTSDPAGTDNTVTVYDGLGRTLSVTNPCRTTSEPTYGVTTYTYDSLGRTTKITNPDSSIIQTTYTGRATEVTDEGNGTKSVQRISQSDALGRLTSVCEVSSTTLSFGTSNAPIACGQDISATGFLTSYQYDALGNLLSVSQGSLNPRTFVYDSLSRLTSSTNPESGTMSYTYDANGNMTVSTGPAPNQTNPSVTASNGYNYDVLNRLYGMNSTNNNIEPNMFLYYDQPKHGDSIGRLTEKGVFSLPINNWFSNSTFTYDAMGRVTTLSECASQNCPPGYYWNATYSYDYLGDVTSWTDAFTTTFSATYNGAGELTSVTNNLSNANYPSPMFSAATYNAPGLLTSATIGSGTGALTENRSYNNRLRPTTLTDGTAYSFNISKYAPDGNILAVTDSVNGSWGYGTGANYTGGYDDLNRLLTAIPAGQAWSYSYAYDRYGNRWQQNLNGTGGSGPAFSTTFDANNRVSDGSVTYDAAGNVMKDALNSYTYDFHHRILSTLNLSTNVLTCYLYDIDGRRVQRVTAATACGYPPTGGTSLYYVYDSSGHVIDEVSVPSGSTGSASTGNWTREEIYAGGRHLATFTPGTSGQAYWDLADWLGTERARVNAVTGAVSETCTSLPWGDNLHCSSADISPLHFTGKERDSESGLDNFGARYNSSRIGRFMSPDPGNAGTVNADPQSWNAYSYVRNNPLNLTDPTGTIFCRQAAEGDEEVVSLVCDVTDADYVNSSKEQQAAYDQAGYTHFDCSCDTGADKDAWQHPNGNVSNDYVGDALIFAAAVAIVRGIDPGVGGPRLPQDLKREQDHPTPPDANGGDSTIGTNPNQEAALGQDIQQAEQEGATDIRVNQEQVNAQGVRVGKNRPDLQYTDRNGIRHYIEYDQDPSSGAAHAQRIRANDPAGIVTPKTIK